MTNEATQVPNRWGISRTPRGGVSIGYTALKSFRACPRRAFWSHLWGGAGLAQPKAPPNAALLYGQLFHAGYRASWRNVPIKEALEAHIKTEGLEAEAYHILVEEVLRDLDWYWQQDRGTRKLEVLACEDELSVNIGKHTLRGTPDLVAREESGTVLIIDHKTFGALSYTANGSPRLELKPRDNTILRYQTSRQFAFYSFLWNRLHPEAPCNDALLNLVPSHATAILGILNDRKGNVELPKIHRVDLEPFPQSYLDELGAQALALCDQISDWWDDCGTFPPPTDAVTLKESLIQFPEHEEACVGYRGYVCGYYDLCRNDQEQREFLLGEAYTLKPVPK